VDGQRAYKLTRDGAPPKLEARTVTVRELSVLDVRPAGDLLDLDVTVTCSSGTYIRALARDLGAALGVGGHLTMLRRTRVGPYHVDSAHTLDALAENLVVLPLADAAAAAFPRLDVTAEQAARLAHGGRLPVADLPVGDLAAGPVAAFGPDGTLIALVTADAGQARPIAVFLP
jgi:tRNA pseudouridine55 synthase